MKLAGVVGIVETVSFYHGGDELYCLSGLVGVWHECCLEVVLESRKDL